MVKKLTPKQKRVLKEIVDFRCENCKEIFNENELEIHRMTRGSKNGEYKPSNIKILCSKCHKDFHYGE